MKSEKEERLPPVRCPRCRDERVRATHLTLRAALRKVCSACGHLWDEPLEEKCAR
jgi:uncharacterized protein (DUF983 family)